MSEMTLISLWFSSSTTQNLQTKEKNVFFNKWFSKVFLGHFNSLTVYHTYVRACVHIRRQTCSDTCAYKYIYPSKTCSQIGIHAHTATLHIAPAPITNTHIHHIHARTSTYTNWNMHVNTHTHSRTHICAQTLKCTDAHTQTVCFQLYSHVCMNIRMQVYTYVYIFYFSACSVCVCMCVCVKEKEGETKRVLCNSSEPFSLTFSLVTVNASNLMKWNMEEKIIESEICRRTYLKTSYGLQRDMAAVSHDLL